MRILITGASRGLGLGLTIAAIANGHVVYSTKNKGSSYPDDIWDELDKNDDFHMLEMDITQEDQVQKALAVVKGKEDAIDCIINNAGILRGRGQTIENIDLGPIRECFEVNTLGAMLVTKYFYPLLKKGRNPIVINISSQSASLSDTLDHDYAYCMSKIAMNMFSEQLRLYSEPQGIKVCAVHPGWVRTSMGGDQAPGDPVDVGHKILDIAEGKTKITCTPAFIDTDGQPMPL